MRPIDRLMLLILVLTVPSSLSPLLAQAPSNRTTDEAAIREAIAGYQFDAARYNSKDKIYWPGSYKRPVVGAEQGEEIPGALRPSLRKPKTYQSKITVVRLEIADAGDMAYEFSNADVSFETTDDKKHSFPTSILRVWRKVDGEWKIAAHFVSPHYQEPEKAAGKN